MEYLNYNQKMTKSSDMLMGGGKDIHEIFEM